MAPMKLTPKQARFVQEYLIDLNAAQAAIRAGYSAKTARVIGHENLTKPDIAAAIEKAKAKRAERTELTGGPCRSPLPVPQRIRGLHGVAGCGGGRQQIPDPDRRVGGVDLAIGAS